VPPQSGDLGQGDRRIGMSDMVYLARRAMPFCIRGSGDESGLSIARSGPTLIGTSPAFKG
jgi:hypothetical protein